MHLTTNFDAPTPDFPLLIHSVFQTGHLDGSKEGALMCAPRAEVIGAQEKLDLAMTIVVATGMLALILVA